MPKNSPQLSKLQKLFPTRSKPVKKTPKAFPGKKNKIASRRTEISHANDEENSELRTAFAVFSKAHDLLNLRINTLFLAFEIYCHYITKVQNYTMTKEELHCVCIYLAIKTEEVKRFRLATVQSTMGWNIQISKYKSVQFEVLQILDYNINFRPLNRQLQAQVREISQQQRILSVYLLQLAIETPQIYGKHRRELIVKAVSMLVDWKFNVKIDKNIRKVMQLLIEAKTNGSTSESSLFSKYKQPKYGFAALQSL